MNKQLSMFEDDLPEQEDTQDELNAIFDQFAFSDYASDWIKIIEERRGIKDQRLLLNFTYRSAYSKAMLVYFDGNDLVLTGVNNSRVPKDVAWIDFYDNGKAYARKAEYTRDLLYCDRLGQVWKSAISFEFKSPVTAVDYSENSEDRNVVAHCNSMSIKENWKRFNQMPIFDTSIILNSDEELNEILRRCKPYTAEWMESVGYSNPMTLLCCPQLEQLYKADYAFARSIIEEHYLDRTAPIRWFRQNDMPEEVRSFNLLCRPGAKPKDIFKTDKPVYSMLKNEPDLKVWNRFRIIYNHGNINQDTLETLYQNRYSEKQLKQMTSIINLKYEDKPVFTWNSLIAYLRRLDMYEAIETEEALPLIKDVIQMSQQLNVQPNVTGDSIKREHDVLARNIRQRLDEVMALKMDESCKKLAKYDYSGSKYFIRGIRSYNDLIDEAKQQHNCVASYASSIVNGRSLIYVMRSAEQPDKSLITVELSPESKEIRQRFLAYNQQITDKNQIGFLDDWVKNVKRCDLENADSITAMLENSSVESDDEMELDQRYIYFSTIPIRVNSYATLENLPLSIESYDRCVTSDSGNTYYGYLEFDEPLNAVDMLSHHLVEDKKENLHVRHNYIHF